MVHSAAHAAARPDWAKPRIDLRTGRCAVLGLAPPAGTAPLAALAAAADPGGSLLSWAPAADALATPEVARALADRLLAQGLGPAALMLEVSEAALARDGSGAVAAVEVIRARGYGVGLIADPAMPLPFGARARTLYTELMIAPPVALADCAAPDPLAIGPLAQRLLAARHAGLCLTALGVRDRSHAAALALVGFDRGVFDA